MPPRCQHPAPDAPDDGIEAIPLRVEDEVAEAASGGPRVELMPLRCRDQPAVRCSFEHDLLHRCEPAPKRVPHFTGEDDGLGDRLLNAGGELLKQVNAR